MKLFKALPIAAIFTSLVFSALPAWADVQTFGTSVKILRYSDAKLQNHQKGLFRLMKSRGNKQYFGAMYFNPFEDTAAFMTQFHSLESAKLAAKTSCQIVSKERADQCQLYATVVPKSFSPETTQASGLGMHAYSSYRGKYRSKQETGKYGAFAISGMSSFGYSFGYNSKEEAIDTALSYCQSDVARFMTRLGKDGRSFARKAGADKCTVVNVIRQE